MCLCACFSGASVICTHLSVCFAMQHCSANVTTIQQDRTVSAAEEASHRTAGDQDLTCPCPGALPTSVCIYRHAHTTTITQNLVTVSAFPGDQAETVVSKFCLAISLSVYVSIYLCEYPPPALHHGTNVYIIFVDFFTHLSTFSSFGCYSLCVTDKLRYI